MFPVKPSIKLGYCKNYTVQAAVAGGVNPQSRFDEPYLYAPKENAAKKTLYRDSGTVTEEETLLLVTQQAEAEAQKRLDLWQDQRYVITADYLPHLMFVQLGDIVEIKSARFQLTSGKLGMVYSVVRNWTTGIVSIGVLV
jgi:lipopolysaccharide export system protein LptC